MKMSWAKSSLRKNIRVNRHTILFAQRKDAFAWIIENSIRNSKSETKTNKQTNKSARRVFLRFFFLFHSQNEQKKKKRTNKSFSMVRQLIVNKISTIIQITCFTYRSFYSIAMNTVRTPLAFIEILYLVVVQYLFLLLLNILNFKCI